jgi:hypothetical protein
MVTATRSRSKSVSKPEETPAQRTRRLAFGALNAGLRILEYPDGNMVFCTSRSQPDRLHRITAWSCDCLSFCHRGYCSHYALYLHSTGQLPDPAPPCASAQELMSAVFCDTCDQVMDYVDGVTFSCPACGREHATDWPLALTIDAVIAKRSATDDQLLDWLTIMLSEGSDAVPAGVDPDQCASRGDVPGVLGVYATSANDVAATMRWQADRQATADRMAA